MFEKFWANSLELNEKKKNDVKKFFFSEVLQCVKLEKKISKINFDKFIWFTGK